MKKMNICYNSKHFLNVLLLIVALLGINTNAWADKATWEGTVSVASGSGTATVEVYNDDDDKTEVAKSTTSSAVTAKYSESTSWDHWWIRKHCLIFTATPSTGYHFVKWTGVNSTLSPYKTASRNSSQSLTLEANFALNTYTVKFEPNRGTGATGTGSMSDQKFTYGTAQNLSANAFTKNGYSFVGWNTKANGTGTSYTDKQRVNNLTTENGAEITLYAQWKANTYTITLNSDLATTHGTTSIKATYDANTNLTSAITVPSRDKWTFWGYFTGENGDGTQLIDRYGNVLASKSGYTDGSKKWKYAGNLTLYAHMTEKSDQTINWDLTEGAEYATGTAMGAVATSGQPVTYTSNHPEWGYINGSGRLIVVEPNKTITITASQAGNDYYNAAPDVTKTFITLGANPNQLTEVTASGITYGQTLSASVLSGNVKLDGVVIPGTLSWVDAEIMPDAGTENHMALFTPENQSAYSSVYFEVPVTVAKATPVITWHITNVLHEQVRYNHFVESSNKEPGADLSFQTSNSSLLNIADDALIIGAVSEKQDGWIKVSQPETDNYNAYNATWSLKHDVTVYPKAKICLPLDLSPANGNAENDYNDARVAITKPGGWCNTNEDGNKNNYIAWFDVRYTQRQGIALGSWEAGLEGINGAALLSLITTGKFDYSSKSVDLFFSGIPNTISFDVESQVVTSSPPDAAWKATQRNWHVYASVDGVVYTQIASREGNGNISYTFVNENVRYVRIVYSGNFTGFVKNLRITRKKYIRSNKSELTFGTEINPLQEPQALTLSYSSLGICGGSAEDAITITSSNPAFYVDEEKITENVGIEQSGSYIVRVRCNDVNQSGKLTFTSNDGTTLEVPVHSTTPDITTAATDIFQTGTEHAPVSGTVYRPHRKIFSAGIIEGLFEGSTPLFDTLYVCGVSECAVTSREWEYSPIKNYNVPRVTASNVHTPCFVYKKDGARYTYVRTFDAAITTLNVADSKTRVLVGYRPESPAATAVQLNAGTAINFNNTEIVATNAAIAVNGNATIAAHGVNIVSSTGKAAVKLSGATTLTIENSWKNTDAAGNLALRPAAGYPSIDLGSANGQVDINGTQLELHNATNMAIAHMDGTTEKFDGEVHINDGSIGGEEILGMPKLTFIDGGTFNDGTVNAYTLKGVAKRPRNSRGEIVSRHTMAPAALADGYSWYGQDHLTPDGSAKVNPMLMDEEVWIFTGDAGVGSDVEGSWNKRTGLPGEDDDVLINAPMVVSGGELKVKSLTINWEDKGKGIPAVTIKPDGGLTVGEGGVDGIKLVNMVDNLVLKAGTEGATKGQTGFLRIHPESAEPMPKATVELYNTGYYDTEKSGDVSTTYQCVGAPIADEDVKAKTVFPSGTWVYKWNEDTEDWTNSRTKMVFEPFKGFETTQYRNISGWLINYTGHLVSGEKDWTIDLDFTSDEKGFNLLANSFTAPISIEKFIDDDFVNASRTIYILNAGTKAQSDDQKGGDFDAPGKWVGVPVETATELAKDGYPCVIPAMQGFWVKATGANAKLNFNYGRLVYDVNYSGDQVNKPLRAPKFNDQRQSITGRLKINIGSGKKNDFVYLLESEQYESAYEDGYDARKIASETMDLFTIRDDERLGVDATNSIVGTRIGVRTGEEMTYTMTFSHLDSEANLMLWDKEAGFKMLLSEDVEYTFNAAPNSEITERFQIIAADIPAIATGVDEVESEVHIQKFIKDNQLYILKDGVLYNASGAVVRK